MNILTLFPKLLISVIANLIAKLLAREFLERQAAEIVVYLLYQHARRTSNALDDRIIEQVARAWNVQYPPEE